MPTSPIATIHSLHRQLYAPRGTDAVEYGANHRNDLSKKIVYVEDAINTIIDLIDKLLSLIDNNETDTLTLSRATIEQRNTRSKMADLQRLDNALLSTLGVKSKEASFELKWDFSVYTTGERIVRLTQKNPQSRKNKYVVMETILVKWDGSVKREKKIDEVKLVDMNFRELHFRISDRMLHKEN